MSDECLTTSGGIKRYCEDCRILTDALRDMEHQCRELEDRRLHASTLLDNSGAAEQIGEEEAYLARLDMLQERRNSALEVLLKHQCLEHKQEF